MTRRTEILNKYCGMCGSEIPDGNQFCTEYGSEAGVRNAKPIEIEIKKKKIR